MRGRGPQLWSMIWVAVAIGCGGTLPATPDAAVPDAMPPPTPAFTEAPALVPNAVVPLAPRLRFATDLPTRVSVALDDGARSFTLAFDTPSTAHDHVLLGLRPGRSHRVTV